MTETPIRFSGPVPDAYDSLLVPLIFAPFAEDMARRVAAINPARLLEIAAGTGAVTRAIAVRLPDCAITATDLNPGMLAVAERRQPPAPPVRWQAADALNLPFGDASFDCAVCQFGVMFFPDRPHGMAEARRVLVPGGHFLCNCWDRVEVNDPVPAIGAALVEIFGTDAPDFMARIPHGYHDPVRIEHDLRQAGFSRIAIETVTIPIRLGSPDEAAAAWCKGTPLRGEIESRGRDVEDVTAEVAAHLARRYGQGAFAGRISAFVVTASDG